MIIKMIDRETVESIKWFDNEIRLLQLKESLDKVIGEDIYSNDLSDEQVAKLDYILCKMEVLIDRSKDVIVQIK